MLLMTLGVLGRGGGGWRDGIAFTGMSDVLGENNENFVKIL
jgi:hypothetical protein